MRDWRKLGCVFGLVLGLSGCEGMPEFAGPEGAVADNATAASTAAPAVDLAALKLAEQALDRGDIVGAQQAFLSVLRGDPEHPGAALGLAQTYVETQQFDTARRFVAMADQIDTDHDRAALSFVIGQLARQDGELLEAVRRFHESISYRPGFWRAWLALGRVQAQQGKFGEAREAFTTATQFAPSQAEIRNDIGMSYIAEKKPSSALAHFEAALADSPANSVARANLRIAQAMLGRYEAAVSGAAQQELADTLNNVGYVAVLNGDLTVADRLLRRAVEVSPTFHEAANANLDLLAQVRANEIALAPQGTPSQAAAMTYRDLTPPGLAGSPPSQDGPPTNGPVPDAFPGAVDAGKSAEPAIAEPDPFAAPEVPSLQPGPDPQDSGVPLVGSPTSDLAHVEPPKSPDAGRQARVDPATPDQAPHSLPAKATIGTPDTYASAPRWIERPAMGDEWSPDMRPVASPVPAVSMMPAPAPPAPAPDGQTPAALKLRILPSEITPEQSATAGLQGAAVSKDRACRKRLRALERRSTDVIGPVTPD